MFIVCSFYDITIHNIKLCVHRRREVKRSKIMAFRRRRRGVYGRRPRSYKAFYARKRRRVSYRTPFNKRGGILR